MHSDTEHVLTENQRLDMEFDAMLRGRWNRSQGKEDDDAIRDYYGWLVGHAAAGGSSAEGKTDSNDQTPLLIEGLTEETWEGKVADWSLLIA